MRFSLRITLLVVAVLALSTVAVAQVSYDAPRFSAEFNGRVATAGGEHSADKGRQDTVYASVQGDVQELVSVRNIDSAITVDYSSSHSYRDQLGPAGMGTLKSSENADFMYQGHPASYGLYEAVEEGVTQWKRIRMIIVDAHTAIFVVFIVPREYAQSAAGDREFLRFANSLVIK